MSQSDSCHGIGTRGPCTNDPQFELDADRELHEMTDDQLAYVERGAALLLGERGLVRDTDPASGAAMWRLDV